MASLAELFEQRCFCCWPRPCTRRLSAMPMSSMILRALTLPTPGSDSSRDTTFSLPTVESVDASASASETEPILSWFLSSARAARASAALARAFARCSGVSCGGVAMCQTLLPLITRVVAIRPGGPARGAGQVSHRARRTSAAARPGSAVRGPRIGERGRADLHRRGAGEQQFGGVPAGAHPADADDRQVGQRGVHVVHGAHRDGVDRAGRCSRRRRRRAPGDRVSGSSTMPSRVFTRVTASAPASCTAAATSTTRSVFGLSLAHRGRPHAGGGAR